MTAASFRTIDDQTLNDRPINKASLFIDQTPVRLKLAGGYVQIFATVLLILLLALPVIVTAASSSHGNEGASKTLENDLKLILNDPSLRSTFAGIVVESLTTGNILFEYNADKRFIPASNIKLFTAAAALIALSPDFRYETTLSTDGTINNGVLSGNLIVNGTGDPAISGHFYDGDPFSVFAEWASTLRAMGVREILGNIVIDNSIFSGEPYGDGWHVDDLINCYAAPIDAFSFNNNCISLTVSPSDIAGKPATITIEPATDYIRAISNVTTRDTYGGGKLNFSYTTPRTLEVTGDLPLGAPPAVRYIAVSHPARFGGFALKKTLESQGIAVKGDILCIRNCPLEATPPPGEYRATDQTRTIAVHYSPKLSEIVKVVNKISNNLYSELLLLTTGKMMGNTATSKEAIPVVLDILKRAGVDANNLKMADGSGLSRHSLVTPRSIVSLLQVMARGPFSSYFMESLPLMGVAGSLANRLQGTPAAGRVMAKTGTMQNIRNMSGYISTENNDVLAFAILFNNQDVPVRSIDAVTDRIILRLVTYRANEKE